MLLRRYTDHLDVYKRQVHNVSVLHDVVLTLDRHTTSLLDSRLGAVVHVVPVSYTHLDVYKRQVRDDELYTIDLVDGDKNGLFTFEMNLHNCLLYTSVLSIVYVLCVL